MKRITGLMNSYEEQGAMGNEAALSKEIGRASCRERVYVNV